MANVRRYFVDSPILSDRATLSGAEAHHLRHVMRAAVGTEVTLFDGSGSEFVAKVASVGRAAVELSIVARAEVDRELPVGVILGVALPKGERQRFLVEKSVELGVGRLVPLITRRSTVRSGEQPCGRLDRIVVEASKQCGRNRLMTIAAPQVWSDFVGRHAAAQPPRQVVRWVAHPAGTGTGGNPLWAGQQPVNPQEIIVAVGPEGGLTGSEVRLAEQAGWSVVGLGPRLLRIETAALVMVAMAAAGGLGERVPSPQRECGATAPTGRTGSSAKSS